MAKVMIVLAAVAVLGVIADVSVGRQYIPPSGRPSADPSGQYGAPGAFGGASGRLGAAGRRGAAQDPLAQPASYGYKYKVSDDLSGSQFGHQERRRKESTNGEYQVLLPDGRTQIVKYTANKNGYNPTISYKEASGSFAAALRAQGQGAGPSALYGAPSGASSRFSGPSDPSTLYGAPSGASDRFSDASNFGGASGPSALYGAPSGASGRFSDANGLSEPSNQYGAPDASSRFSGPPASSYSGSGGFGSGGGSSSSSRGRATTEDPFAEPAKYDFNYEVSDALSGAEFGHLEDRQDESAFGEYRVLLPDGRTQIVEYVADEDGYNPMIRYEEDSGSFADSLSSQGQGGPY